MDWRGLLQNEMAGAFHATEKLFDRLNDDMLDWKPSDGQNWMKLGQLLYHVASSCGGGFKGFVTGDWGFPEGVDPAKIPPQDMLPPAERLPAVESMAQAKSMLEEDKALAKEVLAQCSDDDLEHKIVTAPWDPTKTVLGHRLLQSIEHLKSHKSQLYYYIKLQGAPVGTPQLWGMG